MERDSFNSRLGFILVSAGCAIGIGNVWKFPYVTGANGGGIFVIFYLLFLILMGVPVMTMELAVGRASRKSAVGGYKALEPKGSKWHIHGWFCMAGCYLLMMYYTTVSGWMLGYFVKFLTGRFEGIAGTEGAADQVAGIFGGMLGNTGEMMLWMGLTVVLGFLVVQLFKLAQFFLAEGRSLRVSLDIEFDIPAGTAAGRAVGNVAADLFGSADRAVPVAHYQLSSIKIFYPKISLLTILFWIRNFLQNPAWNHCNREQNLIY